MRPGHNDDLFKGHRFQFGRQKKLPMVQWMGAVSDWYSYYTNLTPDWGDPRWHEMFKDGVVPNEAVHRVIDPPEFEVEPDLVVHLDADVIAAREVVYG